MKINPWPTICRLAILVPALAILSSCGSQSGPEANSTGSSSPTTLTTTAVAPSPEMSASPIQKSGKVKPDKTADGLGVAPKVLKECPANAPIKGRENKKGSKTYFVPDGPSYAEVKPTTCFADVATAEKAGYKAAKAPKAAKAKDG